MTETNRDQRRAARDGSSARTVTRSLGGLVLATTTLAASTPFALPAGAQARPEPMPADDVSTGLPLASVEGPAAMSGRLVDRSGRPVANAQVDMWVEPTPGADPTPVGRLRTRADGRFTVARSAIDRASVRRPSSKGPAQVQNAVFVPSKDGVGLGAPYYQPVVWNPDTGSYDALPDGRDPAAAGEVTVAADPTATETSGVATKTSGVAAASLAAPHPNNCIINGLPRAWTKRGNPTVIATEGQVVASILHDPSSMFETTVRYSTAATTQARVGFALTRGVNAGAGSITATDGGSTVIGNTGAASAESTRAATGANVNRKFLITTNRLRQRWGVQINGQWQEACSAYSFYQSGWVRDWIEQNHDANGHYACPASNRFQVAADSRIGRDSTRSWETQIAWGWSGTLDGRQVTASLGVDKQYMRSGNVEVSDTWRNKSLTSAKYLCGVGGPMILDNRGKVVAQGA